MMRTGEDTRSGKGFASLPSTNGYTHVLPLSVTGRALSETGTPDALSKTGAAVPTWPAPEQEPQRAAVPGPLRAKRVPLLPTATRRVLPERAAMPGPLRAKRVPLIPTATVRVLPEAPGQVRVLLQARVLVPPMAQRSSAGAVAAAGTEGALAPERVVPLLLMASTKTAVSGSSSSMRPAERTAAAVTHAIGATSVVAAVPMMANAAMALAFDWAPVKAKARMATATATTTAVAAEPVAAGDRGNSGCDSGCCDSGCCGSGPCCE